MKRIRFNIASLLGVILVLGVGFAALRESSNAWESGVFTLMLAALLISFLLALHRTGKRQAFWLGFALFGSAYLGLSLVPSINSRLITTRALAYLDSNIPRSIPAGLEYFDYDNDGKMDLYVANNLAPNSVFVNSGNGTPFDLTAVAGSKPTITVNPAFTGSSGTSENFFRIGHSLLALIAAILGGLLSRHLHVLSVI